MTKLVLSARNSEVLRQLALNSSSDHEAVRSLKAALSDQPEQPKMTTDSPAVPTAATASTASAEAIVLEHLVLIRIASWARSEASQTTSSVVDPTQLKLSSLVTGSRVYVPPKPIFKRSQQLTESLAAIQRAQELAEYQRMSSTTPSSSGYHIPSAYVNIAGVDPTLSLSQRITSHTTLPHLGSRTVSRQEEDQAWKDAQRQLSVILNIFLSALATATAAWWASGNASVGNKVLTSMLVGIVTAVAEIVLYSRYSVYVSESRKIKTSRMKGSDVKNGIEGFRPLQLDRVGNSSKGRALSEPTAKEEPS